MRQLLGVYFERFQRPVAAPHRGRNSPLLLVDPDFVLESRSAMRHFTGRAYLPQLVPQEVQLADLH